MNVRSTTLVVIIAAVAAVSTPGCDGKSIVPTGPSASSDRRPPVGAGPSDVCLDVNGVPLPLAPESDRVDLDNPTFSQPTNVSNPLFPISSLFRVLLLGNVAMTIFAGRQYRSLPRSFVTAWPIRLRL